MMGILLKNGNIFSTKMKSFYQDDLTVYNDDDTERIEVDCSDMMIVPGLVDLHVHVYRDATVLGVEPDQYCLNRWSSINPTLCDDN